MRFLPSSQTRVLIFFGVFIGLLNHDYALSAGSSNGFDLSESSLPRDQILHGGPPRDGIPALSNPKLIHAKAATYLDDSARVLGIRLHGQSRAYPIAILNWHEIVNDEIDGQHFAITYCPLCGTGVAFDASIAGDASEFGVSGLLYNSDVLLYDRATESLWSQILGEAIAGPRLGTQLKRLPISHTSWRDWQHKNPATLVLSDDTGFFRDYQRDPYAGYETSRRTYFAVNNKAPDSYHPKEVVLGLEVDGVYKAYPFVELDRQGKSTFSDRINGTSLHINWDSAHRSASARSQTGEPFASIRGFWFAWFAFHPDTQVFKAQDP